MKFPRAIAPLLTACVFVVTGFAGHRPASAATPASAGYTGSAGCRECHEKFHHLWSTSHHGLAMQPYAPAFAAQNLTPQTAEITLENAGYRFDLAEGAVVESSAGKRKSFPVKQVMGGKYLYIFLTELDGGRLQLLPLSYDARKKSWYETTGSFLRHLPEAGDRPVSWKDPLLTFNGACYGCHVSQMSTNYRPETDSYRSSWAESGINCETCHGPAKAHIEMARQTPKGQPLPELRLISTKKMTHAQRTDLCATCHAKGERLTATFTPGDRFFDNFDLATLENPDFYPDGRDLGENYTHTSWSMSLCAKSGKLDCLHCHTSSGRYRFKKENFNAACLPCHENKVHDPQAHTHHRADGEGSRCIACHMPKTEFARMERSDHSLRPPMPAATIRFKSPNACTGCHSEKDPQWADTVVRKWRSRQYQEPVLKAAGLVEAGRARDWRSLEEMLGYLADKNRDEVFATSLIRLLAACQDQRKWPALVKALDDPSPLIRSAAAEGLQGQLTPQTVAALAKASSDDYRLVRIKAASSLASIPSDYLPESARDQVKRAMGELRAALSARPDDFASNYNLGNYHLNTGDFGKAAAAFETAIRLRPDLVTPYVNASIAYGNLGDRARAEDRLRKAVALEPDNAVANFNLGLLMVETGKKGEAEPLLKSALAADPQLAPAAYNLCLLLAEKRPEEALGYCRKASVLRPEEPKYAYTLAYYLYRQGSLDEAAQTLTRLIQDHPDYRDAPPLLLRISRESGRGRKVF